MVLAYKLDVGLNFYRTWMDDSVHLVRVVQDAPAFVRYWVDQNLEFVTPTP